MNKETRRVVEFYDMYHHKIEVTIDYEDKNYIIRSDRWTDNFIFQNLENSEAVIKLIKEALEYIRKELK